MAAVLGIGNATLDIIHLVDRYPEENEEIRCRKRYTRRGGNSANTLVVLSQLGIACSWAGVLVDNAEGSLIRDDLTEYGIDTRYCRYSAQGSVPVSSILLNRNSGTRTIVHYRDMPELAYDDFASIDLGPFDWLHFEGRNVEAVRQMLALARSACPATPCSVEIEKPRTGVEALFEYADVLLFSRVYGCALGHEDPQSLLQSLHERVPQADLYCAWGDAGAAAMDRQGRVHRQAAEIPEQVVDTVGAGDTFNAGIISGYLDGLDMTATLARAVHLAGRKCAQQGFAGLGA